MSEAEMVLSQLAWGLVGICLGVVILLLMARRAP